MISHYLTIALRTLRRQKLYSIINVLGLSIGIGMCVLLLLYVEDETSFDRFHERIDRIVRVTQFDYTTDGAAQNEHVWLPFPFAEALAKDHPAVERTVRIHEENLFLREEGDPVEQSIHFVDPEVFDIFTLPLNSGSPETALRDPNSLVISESTARKLFGTTDVLNRTIEIRYGSVFESATVTGVMEDMPVHSSLPFEILMPFHKLPQAFEWIANRTTNWNASSFSTFALLRDNVDLQQANAVLGSLRQMYYPDEIERWRNEGWTGDGPVRGYRFQPLAEVHLDNSVQGGFVPAGNPLYSYILSGIALGILLLACINFTTLAIGRSAGRAPEIGLRKAVGARYTQIMTQFGGEAVLFGLLGAIGAVAVAELLLPTLNILSGKELSLSLWDRPLMMFALPTIGLLTGLIAGIYPATMLAALQPIATLRQKARLGGSGRLTKVLVVFQFVLSITLIAGTFIMGQQMHFIRSADLGFNHEQVVVVPLNDVPFERVLDRFQTDLSTRPEIEGIAGVSVSFNRGYSQIGWLFEEEERTAYHYNVTSDFVDLLEFKFLAGRDFNPLISLDSSSAIVNRALVEDFGWTPEEALGKDLTGFYHDPTIIGVVDDFHNRSLHEPVEPVILTMMSEERISNLLVRLTTENPAAAIQAITKSWDAVSPETPLEYAFLDDDLAEQYQNEERWSRIVGYSALLAALIACLGLFGLASISVAGRTKEIGIRKTLGASASHIFRLLIRDFAVLVLVASVIAVPVTYFGTQRWLESFAYRIDVGITAFILAIILTMVISISVISYQSIRAARANPVDSLRYE